MYLALGRPVRSRLRPCALIGRIVIPRLELDAIVPESVTDGVLRRAVGHIEGAVLPGACGNAVLAAHRDTFFRHLGQLRPNDVVELATLEGVFRYAVESTQVVDPGDTGVLRASARPTLTLVTCYPFHYVWNAPRRFIVRARLAASGLKPTPDRGS